MDFSNYKFRCSSLGKLATEPKLKKDKEAGVLSETAKEYLREIYAEVKYGISHDIETSQTLKGTEVEGQSITLLSRFDKKMYSKNKERLENDFITGECDIVEELTYGRRITDIKSSWNARTYYKHHDREVDAIYDWQLHGYIFLWNADSARIARVLINTPKWLIDKELHKLEYHVSPAAYEEESEKLIKRLTFDHIPWRERIMIQEVALETEKINRIPELVKKGRAFLQEMSDHFDKQALLTELK